MNPRSRSLRKDDHRGSAESRRRRKQWLLDTFGDGITALCSFCGCVLFLETITTDRYPIPGIQGGTYRRNNIRPACLACNSADGAKHRPKGLTS